MSNNWALYFVEPASLQMEGILFLHEHIFTLLCGILCTVLVLYRRVLLRGINFINIFSVIKFTNNYFYRKLNPLNFYNICWNIRGDLFINQKLNINIKKKTKQFLELFWTIIPAFILVYIAGPSFSLLYSMDEIYHDLTSTIIVQGSQWFWNYEYHWHTDDSFFRNIYTWSVFGESLKGLNASYMISEIDLIEGEKRLLEVTNPLYLVVGKPSRLLVTASDVLHSWAVPSLGVKVDAVPGRLNQLIIKSDRCGIFFGQCSEICGVNHGFMPITVYVVDNDIYNLSVNGPLLNLLLDYCF